ncbi:MULTISPECIES: hypothetical protein [unclassified Streptomyces]|uniref:hypothetical protein n=1 Tax=unclassified Streptomyces TaxID=2593676 RepID=UPI0022519447|nr:MULTISPECIES: hypothetical protein [unclassified Streptomyces]MCX4581402.1 hypothetical protein [Streptomyces sp. NBC_01571]
MSAPARPHQSGAKPKRRLLFEPGLVPPPGNLLDWRDGRHFDRWQDLPCVLCEKPTPMRSHYGEPVHKICAEEWGRAHPTEARMGRFASDVQPKRARSNDDHA